MKAQAYMKMQTHERFQAQYIPVTESGCWIWIGSMQSRGYGTLSINNREVYAHRYSYEFFNGQIADGLVVDHICNVKCCVNPTHLQLLTSKQNVRRAVCDFREFCKHGHPWTPENIRVIGNHRDCRICHRLNRMRAIEKKKNILNAN